MIPWVVRGVRDGMLTTRWPRRSDPYFDNFAGSVTVDPDGRPEASQTMGITVDDSAREAESVCPTQAITVTESSVTVDRGRCILCGRCVEVSDLFEWRPGSDTSTIDRARLVVGTGSGGDPVEQVRTSLARRTRMLRRSVHIRHVDAGSDGSDEWEVAALTNPVYDIHRLGIFLTASPRHADILLVTGVGTAAMTAPLRRTLTAMPTPLVVIAAGTDAISGGLIGGGYASGNGIDDLVDVDIWIPGAPATPFALLHGILQALDRLPASPNGRTRP